MKRVAVGIAVAVGLVFPAAGSAHVHGITPLNGLSCHVDNTIAGAAQADSTPASATFGGPIPEIGLIPSKLGHSSLTAGEGGSGATTANCV